MVLLKVLYRKKKGYLNTFGKIGRKKTELLSKSWKIMSCQGNVNIDIMEKVM